MWTHFSVNWLVLGSAVCTTHWNVQLSSNASWATIWTQTGNPQLFTIANLK